jgi:iron complex outermembrane recepter protein
MQYKKHSAIVFSDWWRAPRSGTHDGSPNVSGGTMAKNVRRILSACASAIPLSLTLVHDARSQATQAPGASQASAAAAQPPATDTSQLQEVVVTALKTGAQQLQRTAEAVSVVSGEQLTDSVINNFSNLAEFIPNASFSRAASHALIYIRGIGSNNFGAGSDPDVTTQIDGVYIARSSGQWTNFIDVDRIEVLRGPQGTLYGRNSVGGTINIISRLPSDSFTGQASLSGGNFGSVEAQGYLSGPLANAVQASFAYDWGHHDPYFKNIAPGGHDLDGGNHGGVRGQLRWEPASDVDATTRVDTSYKSEITENNSHTLAPTPFPSLANGIIGNLQEVSIDGPQNLSSQDSGVSEEINWHFAPGLNLKSISAFRLDYYRFAQDNDQTELFINHMTSSENDKAVSQEFNLQYTGGPLTGVAGLYFFHDNDKMWNAAHVPPSVATVPARAIINANVAHVDSTSGALFAQGTYSFTEMLSAIVGARYTVENKSFDQNFLRTSLNPATLGGVLPGFPVAFQLSKDFSAFTPKFGLNLQVTPDALLYVSATRGYKSGGFNYAATSPAAAEFNPEKIWSYEAGFKTEWLDRRVRFNADAFYYHYTDLQVSAPIAPGVVSITNAATAQGRGVEIEMVAKPIGALQFTVNVSTLDARYESFATAPVPGGLVPFVPNRVCVPAGSTSCTVNATGNYLDDAPSLNALGAIDFEHVVGAGFLFSAHVDYTWHSRTYFDPSNVLIMSQGKYGLLNARVALAMPNSAWRVEVFGNNLTNKAYSQSDIANGLVPAALVGDPRTYGVQVSRSW